MILGEIARLERVLVIVTIPPNRIGPTLSVREKVLFATTASEGARVTLSAEHSQDCLFENRGRAESIAFQLDQWGIPATVRRVAIVTTIHDALPDKLPLEPK